MKCLFDQNISYRILKHLPKNFDGSLSVRQVGLINKTDYEIWEFARKKELVIVTQDSDFNDLNALLGFPPKIIWIRLGNLKTESIAKLIVTYQNDLEDFLSDKELGCFEITALPKY